jgi:hypothetical protein
VKVEFRHPKEPRNLVLLHFYQGLNLYDVASLWSRALKQQGLRQGAKHLHIAGSGEKDVFGVLCCALEIPAKVVQIPDGRLAFAYKDCEFGTYSSDNLPSDLYRFLCAGGKKLEIDTENMRTDSPALYQTLLRETGTTPSQLAMTTKSVGLLNDLGMSFTTMAHIIDLGYWRV